MLHLLDLLKCHLVLAIKDKSLNDLLGTEAKEIRKLLIQLIDLPLSAKMHEVQSLAVNFCLLIKPKTFFYLLFGRVVARSSAFERGMYTMNLPTK